jgi:hypothetical protein
MTTLVQRPSIFIRHIALPQDHGSWVFLFSPLLIGLFAGGGWKPASALLVVAALAAFLIRQPASIAIKALSGRRSRRDLSPALAWLGIYSAVGLLGLVGLILLGFGYLLYLAVPGILVFVWHLYLISRRQERRQMGIELVGAGVLALAAPAAFWVARGTPDSQGWWLFGLVWLQSAASIVYAYLRLEQRVLPAIPAMAERLKMGRRALLYTTFNLVLTLALTIAGILPALLPGAYALQWLETIWGALVRPAVGVKPTRIGVRQLIVSTLFTLMFILAWAATLPGGS